MSGSSADYLASIEALVKNNPKDYDAIIDFGSPYLFTKLQESSTTSSLDPYFKQFAGITNSSLTA